MTKMSCGFRAGRKSHQGKIVRDFIKNTCMILKNIKSRNFTAESAKKVFSSDYSFEIPNYQRPYSWKIDHAGALFEDMKHFAFQDAELKNLKPYFLGSIVLIKKRKALVRKLLMANRD